MGQLVGQTQIQTVAPTETDIEAETETDIETEIEKETDTGFFVNPLSPTQFKPVTVAIAAIPARRGTDPRMQPRRAPPVLTLSSRRALSLSF